MYDFAFAGLKRVERIDAGGIGAGDRDIEAVLLEEATLQRDRQPDLVDTGYHAGLKFHQRLRLSGHASQHQRSAKHQYSFHVHPPSFIGPTLVTQ